MLGNPICGLLFLCMLQWFFHKRIRGASTPSCSRRPRETPRADRLSLSRSQSRRSTSSSSSARSTRTTAARCRAASSSCRRSSGLAFSFPAGPFVPAPQACGRRRDRLALVYRELLLASLDALLLLSALSCAHDEGLERVGACRAGNVRDARRLRPRDRPLLLSVRLRSLPLPPFMSSAS